ncbi:hypothetical protein [Bradyrhizobium sp. SYSU BS000235]|uniref:hypothetical protein n=1 Tax=Bradyrhizobium sp. SYSU BS000235 TaxID=3411332 RepID=UPI003C784C76
MFAATIPANVREHDNHPAINASSVQQNSGGSSMNGIIYLIGLIVVIMAILSFLGLR